MKTFPLSERQTKYFIDLAKTVNRVLLVFLGTSLNGNGRRQLPVMLSYLRWDYLMTQLKQQWLEIIKLLNYGAPMP